MKKKQYDYPTIRVYDVEMSEIIMDAISNGEPNQDSAAKLKNLSTEERDGDESLW